MKTGATIPQAKAGTQTPVPMLDLRRQYEQIQKDVEAAIARVCASQHFIGGEELTSFEAEAASYLGVKDAIGCASGTDALWLALQAAGLMAGDGVITTPFSFFASASSITRIGARPIFVDVEPGTLNLDPDKVRYRLANTSMRIRAIMPVHLYGQCADVDAFESIAAEHKLTMIEDAAQAWGASWRGRRAGSFGRAAAFSFYPTKNLSCFGDGGMVTTNDPQLAERVRSLRNHGSKQRYYHEEIGWNSRLDAMQAAVLRVKLRHIDQWNNARRTKAAVYDRLLKDAGLLNGADAPVKLLSTRENASHIYHQYVIRAQKRDDLRKFLTERKLGTEIYYPLPLHLQQCFRYLGYTEGDLPESERAAAEVLALPIFPELREDEQHAVVQGLAEFYG